MTMHKLNKLEITEYKNSSIRRTIRKITDTFDLLDEYVMKKNSVLEKTLGSDARSYKSEIKQLKEHLAKAEQIFLFDIAQLLDEPDDIDEAFSTHSGDLMSEAKEFLLDEGLKELYAVVDEDGIVIATASNKNAAKRNIVTAELPPLSVDDKTKLKIVKTKKQAEVGYPLKDYL